MQIDFDSLTEAGSMMGSGGLIVMDDKTCMVDIARYFTDFLVNESCGKCTPCREGLFALSNTLKRICEGEGKEEQDDILFPDVLREGPGRLHRLREGEIGGLVADREGHRKPPVNANFRSGMPN